MACQRFTDLPSASAVLTGREIMPLTNASNVDQKAPTGAIAISATEYDSTLSYTEGYQVLAADGNVYRARQTTVGDTPETSPTDWKLILVQDPITLAVPSVYATIISALTALDEAILTAGVTIQVADGAYNYTTTSINLTHPYGRHISIIGNTATPASCSLSFAALASPPTSPYLNPNSGSIYASGPSNVTINGFSILKSGGAPVFGHCGILASDGATINVGTNTIVNGFYADVAALDGGVINAVGVDLVTVSGTFALLADNGTVNAPTSAITGTGGAIATRRNGYVRMNNSTVDAAIVTAVTMASGTAVLTSTTVGNVDTFYDVDGSGNFVSDTGAIYGTASTADISLSGTLEYNGAVVAANNQDLALAQIEANAIQAIAGPNQTVFLDGSIPGVNTAAVDLNLSADGNTGVTVASVDGGAGIPVSVAIGATSAITGIAAGTDVLDASGSMTVVAPWVDNTIVVPQFVSSFTVTGTSLHVILNTGVGFTITSDAGALDSGVPVNWIALDYP